MAFYKTSKPEPTNMVRYTINQNEQIEQWYLHKQNGDGTVTLRKNFKFTPNAKLQVFPVSEVFLSLHEAHLHKEK